MHSIRKFSDELVNRLEREDDSEQDTDWKVVS